MTHYSLFRRSLPEHKALEPYGAPIFLRRADCAHRWAYLHTIRALAAIDGEGRFAETGAAHWQSAIFGVGFDEFVYDIVRPTTSVLNGIIPKPSACLGGEFKTFEEQVVSVVEQYLELRERTTLSPYVEGLPSGAYGRASERMR
ncbi:hypothetical protein E4U37_006261 [Claviceps purpurea]|nr:hypothetical protein E4U37_006261 [Claviceps purpurea]